LPPDPDRVATLTVADIDDGGLWLKTKTALSERGYKRLSRPIHASAKHDGLPAR